MERIQMQEIILLLNINVQPTRANARLQFNQGVTDVDMPNLSQ